MNSFESSIKDIWFFAVEVILSTKVPCTEIELASFENVNSAELLPLAVNKVYSGFIALIP